MRTVDEFMTELGAYFGGFRNDFIMQDIAREIQYIAPGDLDALMRQLKLTLPAAYQPDLKSIGDAVKAAKIQPLNEPNKERVCPSCGKKWYSSGVCPWCCFDPAGSDTPDQWREFVKAHREGKVPHFEVGATLADLIARHNVARGEE